MPMTELRDIWEETSFVLERRQANPHCVQQEQTGLKARIAPPYNLTFDPDLPLAVATVGMKTALFSSKIYNYSSK